MSKASAIRQTVPSVGVLTARSSLPKCARSIPQASAAASWLSPRSSRSCLSASPKAWDRERAIAGASLACCGFRLHGLKYPGLEDSRRTTQRERQEVVTVAPGKRSQEATRVPMREGMAWTHTRLQGVALLMALSLLGAVGAYALGAGTAAAKQKKRVVFPVKITAKFKPSELPPDSGWRNVPDIEQYPVIVAYGRVKSRRPACRRNRPLIAYVQPRGAPAPGKDRRVHIKTDAAGNWEGEPVPDAGLTEAIRTGQERYWIEAPRKRIGKRRFCRAAKTRLKV